MDKRFIKAFFITFLFLMIWSYMMPGKDPQIIKQEEPVSLQAETGSEEPGFNDFSSTSFNEQIEEKTSKDLPQVEIENFFITYSPTGGYIKNISIEAEKEPLTFQNIGLTPKDFDVEFTPKFFANKIIFQSSTGRTKEFVFSQNTIQINLDNTQDSMMLFTNYLDSDMINQRYQELFYNQNSNTFRKYFSDRVFGLFGKGIIEQSLNKISFAGARDRYYCLSLTKGDYKIEWKKVQYTVTEKNRQLKKTKVELFLLSPEKSTLLYLGPQKEDYLQPFELQGIMYYGVFHVIGVFMIKILNFLHSITGNWGVSIMLFSTIIYFILFPLTLKSMKSMRKIQQLQPELNALKAKHKDNPQKFQKESIEFYKKHKINPASGCLPLFFQMPVFIALYQVIFRLYDLKGAQFFSFWIKDLSLPDRLFELPFTIPLLNTNYFNLLPILVMILGFFQQKMSTPSTSGSQTASQQKTMGLFMTVFIGFIFYGFPSALVLYWFTQNIFTLTFHAKMAKAKTV